MRRISYLVSTEFLRNLLYTLIYLRLAYAITAWGSAFSSTTCRPESLTSRAISLIEDQTYTNELQMSPELVQFKGVYDYFVLCKMYINIREQKRVHFCQKIYSLLFPHHHETRSRVKNKSVIPRYSKPNCQNALIFCGIKL